MLDEDVLPSSNVLQTVGGGPSSASAPNSEQVNHGGASSSVASRSPAASTPDGVLSSSSGGDGGSLRTTGDGNMNFSAGNGTVYGSHGDTNSGSDGEMMGTIGGNGVVRKSVTGARQQAHQLSKLRVSPTAAGAKIGGLVTAGSGGATGAGGSGRPGGTVGDKRGAITPVTPTTPVTPVTPVVVTTPSFLAFNHMCSVNECVHEDLQLAAELGKTLLERNRELEGTIRHQQVVIDDHVQEIEYLSKQTAALREVNDSRLRIYEQLEVSIQDLENTNQRLAAEKDADRKKIRNLCGTVETVEARAEELQRAADEASVRGVVEAEARGRNKRRGQLLDEAQQGRRSLSCETAAQCDATAAEAVEALAVARRKLAAEVVQREEAEAALATLAQEHETLQRSAATLQEGGKAPPCGSLEDELAALSDAASDRLCRKCLGSVGGDDTASSNPTVYDLSESIEDGGDPPALRSDPSDCALVRLSNGAMAWGSQESLASMSQVMSHMSSCVTSPATDVSEAPHNSLLSELDTQYRILIEKYEALLEAREQQDQHHRQQMMLGQESSQGDCSSHTATYIHAVGVDEMSGPMSLVVTNAESVDTALKCQRCTSCSCGITSGHHRPKSNLEEFSEVETSSSGFSEGESRLFNRATQTDGIMDVNEEVTPTTELPVISAKYLDLTSPVNPCDMRFQAAPVYKKLFQEIFSVLKKSVDEKESQSMEESMARSMVTTNELNTRDDADQQTDATSVSAADEQTIRAVDSGSSKTINTADDSVTSVETTVCAKNFANIQKNAEHTIKQSNKQSNLKMIDQTNEHKSELNILKPIRPNSLDLKSDCSSRSSSKHRRKRRQKNRVETLKQENQEKPKKQKTDEISISRNEDKVQNVNEKVQKHTDSLTETTTTLTKPHSKSSNLCEHHLRQLNKRKARINRSGNSSKQRSAVHEHSENVNPNSSNTSPTNLHNNAHLIRLKPPIGLDRPGSKGRHRHHRCGTSEESRCNKDGQENSYSPAGKIKLSFPSVEVAKLRKLEMSYAEVLKSHLQRAANRKH